jgi:putative nucleotidyltransferase with HDIG domain
VTDVMFPVSLRDLLARLDAIARDAHVQVHVVGGSVRDALLNREMRDLDIAVAEGGIAFARRLADTLAGHFVLLDDVNAVARIVLDDGAVDYIDVAQLQGDLSSDLRRRDLTIDALAVPLGGTAVTDVTGGLDDLVARTVRMTGEHVFDDDPLRLLRAARIAAELDFDVEPHTATAVRERAARLVEAAPERIRDELARVFALQRAGAALRLLDDLRLLDVLFPQVAAGRGVSQPDAFHRYDVFDHALTAVDAMDVLLAPSPPTAPGAWMWQVLWDIFGWCAGRLQGYFAEAMSEGRSRAALLKLAALLHDVAKPQTRTVDPSDGRIRFYGHAEEGAAIAASILRKLRFSAHETAFVTTLVREHLRPVQLAQRGEAPTARALYRFHRDVSDAIEAVLFLCLADGAAAAGDRLTADGWARQATYMNSLLVRLQGEGGIVHAPRLLNGHDIMSEFGLAEGPRIGQLLEAVREAQAAGEVHDRESALTFVRAQLA